MDQRQNKRNHKTQQTKSSPSLSPDNHQKTNQKEEKKNTISIGLDISTSVVGICVLMNGDLLLLDHIKLNTTKFKSLWGKADRVMEYLSDFKSKCPNEAYRVFVEANAKGFAKGRSSANVLFTLSKFNGIVSYIARNIFGCDPVDINVLTARKQLGIKIDREDKTKKPKEKVRDQVMVLFPDLPIKTHVAKTGKQKGKEILDKECEDEIDAFVLVKAGLIIHPN